MKKFFFMVGLPRSGSTVLASLLNQHPDIYVSGTSPLLDLIVTNNIAWDNLRKTYAEEDPNQILNVYNSIMQGFYQHIDKPIVIDKHRGWLKNNKGLTTIGLGDTKMVFTYRPIAEVISSYIKLINKFPNKPNVINDNLKKKNQKITVENQCDFIWNHLLNDIFENIDQKLKEVKHKIIFTSYEDIIKNPVTTLSKVYNFFEMPNYDGHDFLNIKNVNKENDELFWNIPGLHDIRPELKSDGKKPEDVIGKDLTEYFSRFDLNMKNYE